MREKLIKVIMNALPPCYSDVFAIRIADHLITNDVVPVVSCKTCEHYSADGSFCWRWGGVRCPDHYCRDGERKGNDSI